METTQATQTTDSVVAATASTEVIPEQTATQPSSLLTPVSTDWTTTVPDKFKGQDGVKYEEIFKSYNQLEQKLGKYGLPPESADKYEVTMPEGFDVELPADAWDALKATAYENGYSQKQFDAMHAESLKMAGTLTAQFEEKYNPKPEVMFAKAETTLKEAWGNDYQNNQALAQKAFAKYDNGKLDVESLGRNADVMQLLAEIGRDLGEDKGAVGSIPPGEDIEKLLYSPEYQNPNHPSHARAASIVNAAYAAGWKLPSR